MSTFFPNSGTSVALPVPIADGGTGQATAGAAFNALSPLTTNGDLVTMSGGIDVRLPIGTAAQVLTVSAGLPSWEAPAGGFVDPMTTNGDLITEAAGIPARVAIGSAGQVLTVVGGAATWATPAMKFAALGADVSNSTTTAAKITGLDLAVGIGTWKFEYSIIHQAAATTTGIAFSVNHSGTLTRFVAVSNYVDTGTTNLNNAQKQAAGTPTYIGGVGSRVKSATANMGPTTSIDTANADALTTLEGIMVVSVAGNIELYSASEVAAQTTVKKDSVLILTQII